MTELYGVGGLIVPILGLWTIINIIGASTSTEAKLL